MTKVHPPAHYVSQERSSASRPREAPACGFGTLDCNISAYLNWQPVNLPYTYPGCYHQSHQLRASSFLISSPPHAPISSVLQRALPNDILTSQQEQDQFSDILGVRWLTATLPILHNQTSSVSKASKYHHLPSQWLSVWSILSVLETGSQSVTSCLVLNLWAYDHTASWARQLYLACLLNPHILGTEELILLLLAPP